jgi:hypothetical protein
MYKKQIMIQWNIKKYTIVQVANVAWYLGNGCASSGERPTVNEAVGRFSVFLATRISHSICASQVSGYVVRPVVHIASWHWYTWFP